MKIFDHLAEMERDLSTCEVLALDPRVGEISLVDYQKHLEKGLQRSLQIAKRTFAEAIYFEYDLDNGWDSTFFICPEYFPPEQEDEDWARSASKHFAGPSLPEFAALYEEFDSPTTVALIAATVLAYARACQNVESAIPLCIAFRDQDPILRIR